MLYVPKHIIVLEIRINSRAKALKNKTNAAILNKETYKRCLLNKEQIICANNGFRYINNNIKTYKQVKVGLNSIYTKAVVFDDEIRIRPLII